MFTEWPLLTPAIIRESTHHGMRKDLPFIDMIILELPKRDVKFTEKEQELLNGVKVLKQQADEGEFDLINLSFNLIVGIRMFLNNIYLCLIR